MPFHYDAYLSELTTLRDKLKTCLSGTNEESGTEQRLSVSELAKQIKELKAAHTVEAMPERVGKRRSSAEEPVTTRIRRRMEEILAPECSINSDDER
jgi:hypothetical protein